MNRRYMQFRSFLFRTGGKRAAWLRKKKIFGAIGENVRIQDYHLPFIPQNVFIGSNVRIASGVTFVTHDISYQVLNNLYKTNVFKEKAGNIVIGDNVFIGGGTMILYNVRIGNNVIVGAGSVVTRDLPDNSVCAGVPCRKIGEFDDFVQKRLKESKGLEESK
ncbi:MAG: acyltransferase [Clostridia bacterium]|nr:acyltransferase [Clostridia bacterium]